MDDEAAAAAVDALGYTYITGDDGFGALPGPDRTFNGSRDAFVVAIGPD